MDFERVSFLSPLKGKAWYDFCDLNSMAKESWVQVHSEKGLCLCKGSDILWPSFSCVAVVGRWLGLDVGKDVFLLFSCFCFPLLFFLFSLSISSFIYGTLFRRI